MSSQAISSTCEFVFDYNKSIKESSLKKATKLIDINPGFPHQWIDEENCKEVILTVTDGESRKTSTGDGLSLSQEQLKLLADANSGSILKIEVGYHSINAATNEKTTRRINFSRAILPDSSTSFPGGNFQRDAYLKKHLSDIITDENTFREIDITETSKYPLYAIVQFRINKAGKAANIDIQDTNGNENMRELLTNFLNEMPPWMPAKNRKGKIVSQPITLLVGNIFGC